MTYNVFGGTLNLTQFQLCGACMHAGTRSPYFWWDSDSGIRKFRKSDSFDSSPYPIKPALQLLLRVKKSDSDSDSRTYHTNCVLKDDCCNYMCNNKVAEWQDTLKVARPARTVGLHRPQPRSTRFNVQSRSSTCLPRTLNLAQSNPINLRALPLDFTWGTQDFVS